MNKLYYLAYGSNLHPLRLMKRVPSATEIGVAEITDTMIVFHKRSVDGSGKCMLLKDEVNRPVAHGALFSIDVNEQSLLDKAEGCGKGYFQQQVKCPVGELEYPAFTYVAQAKAIDSSLSPFHWYKELVLVGARYHQFPENYIAHLEEIESIQDPDTKRRTTNEQILNELKMF